MDKTTHAKITINDAGETEVRELNVVSDTRPGRRHSILSIDMSQATERIDQESAARLLRVREEMILALDEDDRRRLWESLRGQICVNCGGNLTGSRCRLCDDSAERNDTNDPNGADGFDADVDGIDPEHYEQPPRLSAEDEAILDRIWDGLGKPRATEQEVDMD